MAKQRNNYINFMGQAQADRRRIIESQLPGLPQAAKDRAELFAKKALLRMVMGEAAYYAWEAQQSEVTMAIADAKKAELGL